MRERERKKVKNFLACYVVCVCVCVSACKIISVAAAIAHIM